MLFRFFMSLVFLLISGTVAAQSRPVWTNLAACQEQLHLCWSRKDYENGMYYIGEWRDGKRHGFGELWAKGSSIPTAGYWTNDQPFVEDKELAEKLSRLMKVSAELDYEAKRLSEKLKQVRDVARAFNPSNDYARRLAYKIRSNTIFSGPYEGNPRAEFVVELSSECEVISVNLRSGSGNETWDKAAEQSIRISSPLPKPPTGSCPKSMLISHQPHVSSTLHTQ
jgi:hypothetical protein